MTLTFQTEFLSYFSLLLLVFLQKYTSELRHRTMSPVLIDVEVVVDNVVSNKFSL